MVIDAFHSFNLAVVLFISGKILAMKIESLRRYSIPEPVVGGFLCAAFVAGVYQFGGYKIVFDLAIRDYLLLLFFAGIGLKSDIRTLLRGGKPLLVLTALAAAFIVMQNFAGMGIASLFGVDPKAGLMLGSISLTGGVGTTLAWAPIFEERLGIGNALELGIAGNTLGLIAACVIGGPIAAHLIDKRDVTQSNDTRLDVGTTFEGPPAKMDYFCVLWAVLFSNIAVLLGTGIHSLIVAAGIVLPQFVGCLIGGILIRNLMPLAIGRALLRMWPGVGEGLALISDIALGLFLIMALMGLQFWELHGAMLFILTAIAMQIVLAVAYIVWIVFPAMGRDYEAVVMASGFGGIALGSTATAIANMTAVTQQYGAAHRAFIVVPLVCGFFIDLVNAGVIALFVR